MHHACPHHALALIRNRVECIDSSVFDRRHADSWRCERCDGLWLPGTVVRRVVGESPRWPAVAETAATSLLCPDGHGALRAVDADGIELDLCGQCHGVWLDRGELEEIVARRHGRDEDDEAVEDLVDTLLGEVEQGIDNAARRPCGASSKCDADGDVDVPAPGGGAASMPSGGPAMGVRAPSAPSSSGNVSTFDVERARVSSQSMMVEHDPRLGAMPVSGSSSSTDVGGGDFDLLGTAGDALEAVFSFIGDAFSL